MRTAEGETKKVAQRLVHGVLIAATMVGLTTAGAAQLDRAIVHGQIKQETAALPPPIGPSKKIALLKQDEYVATTIAPRFSRQLARDDTGTEGGSALAVLTLGSLALLYFRRRAINK